MQHENLATALAAFQAETPKIIKDATAKVTGESKTGGKVSYTYDYADLATVIEAVSPVLGKHGLAFTSRTVIMPNVGFVLEYKLTHESGEEEIGHWPLPDPTRTTPQEMGKHVTYARRYAFMAATNTFPDKEDDDAAGASPVGRGMSQQDFDNLPRERPGAQQARQAAEPVRGESGAPQPPKAKNWAEATDEEVAGFHRKLETLVPIGDAVKLYDWLAKFGLHNRQVTLVNPMATEPDADPLIVNATEVLAYRFAEEAASPKTPAAQLDEMREIATARGLLKIMVSEGTTLDEELAMARDLLNTPAGDAPAAG
jgi:hypothetical protein